MSDLFDYDHPMMLFTEWFEAAKQCDAIKEPTAMCLATADISGIPSARIVLLKEYDPSGFIFYTNLESRKSQEIKANPNATLCFYWMPLDRQIRIDGTIIPVSDEKADAYFASRSREKQIGAWASQQSQSMESRHTLEEKIDFFTEKFKENNIIPRPPYWGGWKLAPKKFEFWCQRDHRLHERYQYIFKEPNWEKILLFP